MVLVFDEHKRYCGCSDAEPKAIEVEKGKYTAMLQVSECRHKCP